ncbi:hypothetical protein EMIHUDRAFT_434603 [Emiliania huxleyi CCMP1516]|uniref:PAS domain-containing protein n=2 Tax=Emiliania huxleyi TaxID=2903 RepID=A0A0D3IQ53_EMIH1|nr:hypothetical protein EMIHUDRAFT_445849 [Emiliania huxleyi CCMP1516]XP_005781639.1 hypothetical protein EMIHUDRAFT_434603 [Emiliania huxleyi CCMP1516]EOD13388.1 hypothetical protein EMIHUDRAFT_445849 [Emiliania huxleyi CCMP1516]EOD29210.1 hypothetical protein EMIHUDRAFT_434603 [Emiliania huxleyi CCMP1516]|eukprot:XP_005765817.1 hypothetical protein EMIHUDRAFT_445849 [Emiliania huxleyi CCMP1516]
MDPSLAPTLALGGGGGDDARKRPGHPAGQAACRGAKAQRTDATMVVDPDERAHESTEAFGQLTPVQKAVIRRMLPLLDTETDSVVITNPLVANTPIVHVTQAWQAMCGYTTRQACGQNPRLTQGEGTCKGTIQALGNALSLRQPCRVRLLNYRGYNREPFWNCLTVHPVFHKRELVLYAARLQDYSYRLNRLVSVSPVQFCKSDPSLSCRISLAKLGSAGALARPMPPSICVGRIEELDSGADDSVASDAGAARSEGASSASSVNGSTSSSAGADSDVDGEGEVIPCVPLPLVKRLAFPRLALEPEYLRDRLQDECAQLDWQCHTTEIQASGHELVRLELFQQRPGTADVGVRALVHVLPEQEAGVYSLHITRLSGDTFAYHALFRQLRQRLHDIVAPQAAYPVAACGMS